MRFSRNTTEEKLLLEIEGLKGRLMQLEDTLATKPKVPITKLRPSATTIDIVKTVNYIIEQLRSQND